MGRISPKSTKGPCKTIAGISNVGGDIDFAAGAGMNIVPNDNANTITFISSGSGNGSGTDTLDDVCDRGSTTDQDITAADLKANGDIYINDDETDANAILHFKSSGSTEETLWMQTNGFFNFSKGLLVHGILTIDQNITVSSYIYVGGEIYGNSNLTLNYLSNDQDIQIIFYKPNTRGVILKWNKTTNRFEFSDSDPEVSSCQLFVDGDFVTDGASGRGVIVADKADGTLYRITVISGSVACEAV